MSRVEWQEEAWGLPSEAGDASSFGAVFGGGEQPGPQQQQQEHEQQQPGRGLLAAASNGNAITALSFVTAAPGADPQCPPPPPGSVQSLLPTNIKRGAAGGPGARALYACVSTGEAGPFIASLQLSPPGAPCPAGTLPLAHDLNNGFPAPRVLPCVTKTDSAPAALRALRVVFADRGGSGPCCGTGFTLAPGDANAGVPGALWAAFCVTARDQGLLLAPHNPAASQSESTLLVHPLSEGLDSCLTIAGGAASNQAGMRVAPWPCGGGWAPGHHQQWKFAPQGDGRLQIKQAASGLCLSSLNGDHSLVYQYECKRSSADGGPLPWQLWRVEPAATAPDAPAVVKGGGGVYRIKAVAGGWCMQVRGRLAAIVWRLERKQRGPRHADSLNLEHRQANYDSITTMATPHDHYITITIT